MELTSVVSGGGQDRRWTGDGDHERCGSSNGGGDLGKKREQMRGWNSTVP